MRAVVALAHNRSARPNDIADKEEGFAEALLALLLFVPIVSSVRSRISFLLALEKMSSAGVIFVDPIHHAERRGEGVGSRA